MPTSRSQPIAPTAALLASGVLLLLAFLGSAAARRQQAEAESAARESLLVRGETEQLFRRLVDIETATRGFMLTGRETYLEPYLASLPEMRASLAELTAALRSPLHGDTAQGAALLRSLEGGIDRKLRIVDQQIALRRSDGLLAAVESVRTESGRQSMDSIRGALAAIEELLASRSEGSLRSAEELRRDADRSALLFVILATAGIGVAILGQWRTVRQRADERATVARERHRLAAIIEGLGGGIVVVDHAGRVTLRNSAATDLTGEADGTPDTALHTSRGLLREDGAEPIAATDSPLARALRGEASDGRLALHRSDNGAIRHLGYLCRTLRDAEGRPMGAVIVLGDAEEQLRLEMDLRSARLAADEANEAKSSFLATMSHEIRTPLYGIVGTSDLLRHTPLDARQSHLLDRIRSSSFTLMETINDILDFSKIEAGHLTLEQVPFLLRTALEASAFSLYSQARNRGIGLFVDIDPAIDFEVIGDQFRLRQILNNLLGNAIKFSAGRPNASVWFTARLTEGASGRAELALEIRDNGIGIAADRIGLLFKPFTQAEAHTTRSHGGTGLGLAIVRRLLDAMGGTIGVESTAGVGATFRVFVGFAAATDMRPQHAGVLEGLRILRPFSLPGVTDVADRYLAAAGARVTTLRTALPAVVGATLVGASTAGTGFDVIVVGDGTAGPLLAHGHRIGVRLPPIVRITDDLPGVDATDSAASLTSVFLPLRLDDLIAKVARACGRSGGLEQTEARVSQAVTIVTGNEALILVAEDNAVNRELLSEQLAALGYRSMIGADGREALRLYGEHEFAAVLTDCHMPHLDGYGLTVAIREMERETNHHVPIIAITADVTPGEVARCRLAGMDDYLSKPMTSHELGACLARWLPAAVAPPAVPTEPEIAAAAVPTATQTFDRSRLKDFVSVDPEVQRNSMLSFLASAQEGLTEIGRAVELDDAQAASHVAHRLRSTASAFGASALAAALAAIERAPGDLSSSSLRSLAGEALDLFAEFEPVARLELGLEAALTDD